MSVREIRVTGLTKRYGKKTALDRVSLRVNAGETIAFCGLNGAGKSTLLRILAGALRPTEGLVEGLSGFRPGYMPDAVQFPRGVRGGEWLSHIASLKGVPESEAREILAEMGLEKAGREEAASYSRGMLQRLLFAQALLGSPDLVLMDEPQNGLDPFWAHEWKLRVKELRDRKVTVVFSSHRLGDALETADRMVLFHRGRIIGDDLPSTWTASGLEPERYLFGRVSDADSGRS
jgi:ABC-type multidrug transport system ATPase subunit